MKQVVVFGAGLVVRAHVRYLLDHGFAVTVASRTVSKAEAILDGHPNGTPMAFDVGREPERLGSIVAEHDLAVSLLPWQYHPQVARACLDAGKHMVTTSYVKDAMAALDGEAKAKGVILLNELGVDPGIDHMTAMKVIHRVQAEGGEITTFQSYCGGLPAPEANDNPYGYKFSWSPRGVLLAGLNNARFKRYGKVVEVPGRELFDHVWKVDVVIEGVEVELEGYPNRDSMPYTEPYGIDPRDVMFRGTLRYPGWCAAMKQVARLGWLGTDELAGLEGRTYADVTARLIGADDTSQLRTKVAAHLGLDPDAREIANMEWLGLLGSDPLPGPSAPVDILTARMLEKMSYKPGERDMLVLQHTFLAEFPDRREHITSTMIDFGIPGGDSSMNRTVGLPAAVGARFILEGRFTRPGVIVPVMPEFYEPALEELERLGIHFHEEVRTAPPL
ncbi:MAG TPA: saccharopine dehydrogenase C-terminal domain-containing protein [Candidatus Sulfomarinibacteraceae bacterium]|nr:saccharopine dehydrogenase C-terminal domain-containing protein [Candidatus Sulfomarinibacteraceae bacterium]